MTDNNRSKSPISSVKPIVQYNFKSFAINLDDVHYNSPNVEEDESQYSMNPNGPAASTIVSHGRAMKNPKKLVLLS